MKKVLLFLVALLALCSYSANAVENEEYEVICVIHGRTNKWIDLDTLFSNNIIYTEREVIRYAESCIPERFRDTLEEYYVYNAYYLTEKTTKCLYRLWYTALRGNERRWEWEEQSWKLE